MLGFYRKLRQIDAHLRRERTESFLVDGAHRACRDFNPHVGIALFPPEATELQVRQLTTLALAVRVRNIVSHVRALSSKCAFTSHESLNGISSNSTLGNGFLFGLQMNVHSLFVSLVAAVNGS